MSTKSIAVIGQGFVGGSLTTVLSEHGFDVFTYDKAGKQALGGKHPTLNVNSISQLVEACEKLSNFSRVYFVCVPTPMYEDGSADLSIVETVLRELASVKGERIAVIKSTVPPGSTEIWNKLYTKQGLHVIFNPEFLTEANALDDMRNQNRVILGGPRPWINTVKLIFQSAFPKIPVVKTSSTTAEMVKYTINCFLATKVAFANEIAQICESLDKRDMNVDYDKVIEYAKIDTRLGNSHWSVPGPVPTHDGRYVKGFGGHCVVAGTQVLTTTNGYVNVEDLKPGMVIRSVTYDITTYDNKVITEKHSRLYAGDVYKFKITNNNKQHEVICTSEHLLPVKRLHKFPLLKAKDILSSDELFIRIDNSVVSVPIDSITKEYYLGTVHNIELASNNMNGEDDLFWICDDIIVHNCFPKDMNALITVAKDYGVDPKILQAAWDKNLELRPSEDRDWEHMQGRAVSKKPTQK